MLQSSFLLLMADLMTHVTLKLLLVVNVNDETFLSILVTVKEAML